MWFDVFLLCLSWMNIVWPGALWCQLDLENCNPPAISSYILLHKFLALGPGPNELKSTNCFHRIWWFYIIHNSSFKKWLHFFLCWTCFSVHVSHGLELKSLQRGLRGWNGQIAVVAVSVRLSAPFRLFPFHSVTLSNKSHGPSWFAFLDYCMHNLGSSRHRVQKIKSV